MRIMLFLVTDGEGDTELGTLAKIAILAVFFGVEVPPKKMKNHLQVAQSDGYTLNPKP